MRYTALIDNVTSDRWGLSIQEAYIFSWIYTLPSWAKKIIIDEKEFYFSSRKKVCEDMPLISDKPDTIYRYYKELQKKGIIVLKKFEEKDCICLTEKAKEWGVKVWQSEHSENNSIEIGKKFDMTSEDNSTDYINSKDYINNNSIIGKKQKFLENPNESEEILENNLSEENIEPPPLEEKKEIPPKVAKKGSTKKKLPKLSFEEKIEKELSELPEGKIVLYNKFKEWYDETVPRLHKLEQQPTPNQILKLIAEYGKDKVKDILQRMDNQKDIYNKVSVYLTAQFWLGNQTTTYAKNTIQPTSNKTGKQYDDYRTD